MFTWLAANWMWLALLVVIVQSGRGIEKAISSAAKWSADQAEAAAALLRTQEDERHNALDCMLSALDTWASRQNADAREQDRADEERAFFAADSAKRMAQLSAARKN
jgi:hypothetical protein